MILILVNAVGHSVEDPLGAFLMGEETHRSGSSPYLTEVSLQHVSRTDLLPELLGEGVIVKAVVEVFLHTPDCPFFLHLPFLLPHLEAVDCLPATRGIEDTFSLCHAGLHVYSF